MRSNQLYLSAFPNPHRHEITISRAAWVAGKLAIADLRWIAAGSVWRSRSSQPRRAVFVWHTLINMQQRGSRSAIELLYSQLISNDITHFFDKRRIRVNPHVAGAFAFVLGCVQWATKSSQPDNDEQHSESDVNDVSAAHIKES